MTMKKILAKIFFCDEGSVGNVLMHIPVGLINVAIGIGLSRAGFPIIGLGLSVVFGFGFLRYEINEQKAISDKAYQDIKGWLWGIGILSVPLLLTGV